MGCWFGKNKLKMFSDQKVFDIQTYIDVERQWTPDEILFVYFCMFLALSFILD